MTKLWYWTQEKYDGTKATFREVQMSKQKFNSQLRMDEDWEPYIYLTRKKMTNTWDWLQKEYNTWDKSRYRHDTIYFILH